MSWREPLGHSCVQVGVAGHPARLDRRRRQLGDRVRDEARALRTGPVRFQHLTGPAALEALDYLETREGFTERVAECRAALEERPGGYLVVAHCPVRLPLDITFDGEREPTVAFAPFGAPAKPRPEAVT